MSSNSKKLLLVFAALATLAAISWRTRSLSAIVTATALQSPRDPSLAERIARIENGLLPAVVIKGQPPAPMTIADRMAHYKVPGVSVAFFDHGQILWTRAYGLADVAAKKPVTPGTLFQAASISKLSPRSLRFAWSRTASLVSTRTSTLSSTPGKSPKILSQKKKKSPSAASSAIALA